MRKKVPAGITLSAVLFIIWPVFYLARIVLLSLNLTHFFFFPFLPDIPNLIFLLQKILFIICGIGLLKLRKWARILVLALSLFGIVSWVISIIIRTPAGLINKIIHILGYVVLLWFFSSVRIKAQFKK